MPVDGGSDGVVHRLADAEGEIGWIAIDSVVGGRARGGLRMVPDATSEEVRLAARAMTLKYGLLGLPQGGAKAAIRADGEASPDERRHHLRRFARAAEPWLRARRYVPDADMGTTASDVRWLMEEIGLAPGPREWRANRSGDYTAASCVAAAVACLERLGLPLAGATAAVQGFGKVGAAAAVRLRRRGARVVAVSTTRGAIFDPDGIDVDRLAEEARRMGSGCVESAPSARKIPPEDLLALEVDVLLPCARQHALHAENAGRVRAAAVCSGANDGVSPEAEAILAAAGVLVPPDFVVSSGGVLGGTLEFAGVTPANIEAFIHEQLRPRVAELLAAAAATGAPLRSLAERTALARHEEIRARADRPSLGSRASDLLLRVYHLGLIPRFVAGLAARPLMARRMA